MANTNKNYKNCSEKASKFIRGECQELTFRTFISAAKH